MTKSRIKKKVAFLGPAGSYSHQVCLEKFEQTKTIPCNTFDEIFNLIEEGKADLGVVPVENVLEGTVKGVIDLLIQNSPKVLSEHYQVIDHALLSKADKLSKIRVVYSQTQGLIQTSIWLKKNLSKAKIKEVSSTSEAANLARKDAKAAAIASKKYAKKWQLKILTENISNNPINVTRFFVIGPRLNCRKTDDKFSIFVVLADKVGALLELLKIFAASEISLTKIESRPIRGRIWQYGFLIDAQGNLKERRTLKALKKINNITTSATILGSYKDKSSDTTYLAKLAESLNKVFLLNWMVLEQRNIVSTEQFSTSNIYSLILRTRLSMLPSVVLNKLYNQLKLYQQSREREINARRKRKVSLLGLKELKKWEELVKQTFKLSRELQKEMQLNFKLNRIRKSQVLQYDLPVLRSYMDLLDDSLDELIARLPIQKQRKILDQLIKQTEYARKYLRENISSN